MLFRRFDRVKSKFLLGVFSSFAYIFQHLFKASLSRNMRNAAHHHAFVHRNISLDDRYYLKTPSSTSRASSSLV